METFGDFSRGLCTREGVQKSVNFCRYIYTPDGLGVLGLRLVGAPEKIRNAHRAVPGGGVGRELNMPQLRL